MKNRVLVISNHSLSSTDYKAGLWGFGFQVEETRTFEAAQVLLRVDSFPEAVILDMQHQSDEIAAFIHSIRHNYGNQAVRIIVVGGDQDRVAAAGATMFLKRPVYLEDMLALLMPSS